jgi:hypothetical protein
MEKLTSRVGLEIFQTISDQGERTELGYCLEGITAYSSIDGYTVHMTDGVVTVHLMFHHSMAFDSPNQKATDAFLKKLARFYPA